MKYELTSSHYIILSLISIFVSITAVKVSKSITVNEKPQQVNSALSDQHAVDYQSLDDSDKVVPLSWNPSVGTMQDEKRELKQLEQFNAEIEASLKRGDSSSINDEDDPRFQKRVSDEIHSKVSAIKEEIKRDAELVSKIDHNAHPNADIMVEGDVDVDEKDEKVGKSKPAKHHSNSHASSRDDKKAKAACNKMQKDKVNRISDSKQEAEDQLDQKEGPDDDFKDPREKENSNKQADDDGDISECNRSGPKPKGPPGKKDGQKRNDKKERESKSKVDSVDEAIRREIEEIRQDEQMDDFSNQESIDSHSASHGQSKKRSEDVNADGDMSDDLTGNIELIQKSKAREKLPEDNNEEESNNEEQNGGVHEQPPENDSDDIDLGLLDIVQTIHALRKRDAVYDRLFGGTRREKRSSNNQRNHRRENYIRALEESFPNPSAGTDIEQDSLEPHVRVKRRNPRHLSKKFKNKFVY